jgi:3',5'-nucleoside bisphosphate phosphatase
MRSLRADLHVHTVLSPCAGVEMIPPLIVRHALAAGLDWIAITDHNASANVSAVQLAARGSPLAVLPGMEVHTIEEVHVLCLFDTLAQLEEWQAHVDAALPELGNNPHFFGEQFIVDETGDFIRRDQRLLLTATKLSLSDTCELVTALGGLAIPAHVNRKAFGLYGALGFLPAGLPLEALEISRHISPAEARQRFPDSAGLPFLQSGDVHYLGDFLGACHFYVEEPTIAELKLALHGHSGRSLILT